MSSNIVALSDEAARAAIAELCNRREPAEAKKFHSAAEWETEYERPWVLTDERYLRTSTEIEGGGRAIYCRVCPVPRKHDKIAAFKLHVTYDEDVLKVSKHGLIRMRCHNCGFDMHQPRKPKVRQADFQSFDEQHQKMGAQKYQSAQAIAQQQSDIANRIYQMRAAGFPAEYLEKMAHTLEREHRERLGNSVSPPIVFRDPLDPNKWPGV